MYKVCFYNINWFIYISMATSSEEQEQIAVYNLNNIINSQKVMKNLSLEEIFIDDTTDIIDP